MPAWIPLLGFSYNEQDGFSAGPKFSALNLGGRAISLSARAYFGGAEQYSAASPGPGSRPPHVVRLLRRAAQPHRHAERIQGDELRVQPRGRPLSRRARPARGQVLALPHEERRRRQDAAPDNQTAAAPGRGDRLGHARLLALPAPGLAERARSCGAPGGDGDFWSLNLDLRRWIPLTRRQRLIVSGLASLQSGTVGVDLPEYLIYRMGGANSIRGYSIEDLGGTLYGKNQLIGTARVLAEPDAAAPLGLLEVRLRLGLDFAFFTDAGIAWSEPRISRCGARGRAWARASACWCPARRWCASTWAGAPRGLPLPLRERVEAGGAAAADPVEEGTRRRIMRIRTGRRPGGSSLGSTRYRSSTADRRTG